MKNKLQDDGALIATIRVGNNVDDNTFAIKYIVGDHLNNSTAVLKTTGTLINREDTREENARWAFDSKGTRVAHPFGETSFGGFQYKRYRYNGKEKDEESGLYEYGQRYYAPWLCRFVSVDPIAEDYPQLSSYNYAGNKPICFPDIDGLQSPAEEKPVVGGGGGTPENTNTGDSESNKRIKNPERYNKNIHNAPERTEYEGRYGVDYKEATEGLAGTAFSPSNDTPGHVNTNNPNYTMEVFWNPEFQNGMKKGAYFWQRSKVEPRVDMEKISIRGVTTDIVEKGQIQTPDIPKTPAKTPAKTPESDKPKVEPFKVGQTTVLNIDHFTDGTLILDKNGRSHDLDQIVQRIIATGNQVGSITLNSQIGIGKGRNELEFSQNLFDNVSNYIRQQLPDVQINRGWVGPASGAQRVSPTHPSSLIIQPPR